MGKQETPQARQAVENDAREKSDGKDPAGRRQTGAEEPTVPMHLSSSAPVSSAFVPANDSTPDKPPPPPPEHVARVMSERVQKLIARRLVRKGVPAQDREDWQTDVTMALLYMPNPPSDDDGCCKAANDIINKMCATAYRQAKRRELQHAGLTDQADDHAQDGGDRANARYVQRRATIDAAQADGTLTARDAQIFEMKHDGLSDAEIAAKLGIAQQTVSNRVSSLRKKLREKWQARMTKVAALSLLLVFLAILGWRKREEFARLFHRPAPAPVPTSAPPRPAPEPSIPVALQQAAELRQEAAEQCAHNQLARCSDLLEQASKLDPGGDSQPEVRALRHQVEDGIRPARPNEAKHGYRR